MELANLQHENFAQHVASGLSLTESAKRAGYKDSAANNMGSRISRLGHVAARIEEIRTLRGTAVLALSGIRSPASRVTALEDRWERMRRVILERATDPDMASVPGGKTGLLAITWKSIGSGPTAQVVREVKVDTALLSEIRATEEQAAQELGQWITRKESASVSHSFKHLSINEINDTLRREMRSLSKQERAELSKAIESEADSNGVIDITDSVLQADELASQ